MGYLRHERACFAVIAFLFVLVFVGCSGDAAGVREAPASGILWSSEPTRPTWTMQEPEREGENLIFVGVSEPGASENEARNHSYQDALRKFALYCGVDVKVVDLRSISATSHESGRSLSGEVTTTLEERNKQRIDVLVSSLKPSHWYSERQQAAGSQNGRYVVWVKCRVPEREYQRILEGLRARRELGLSENQLAVKISGDANGAAYQHLASMFSGKQITLSTNATDPNVWNLRGRFTASYDGRDGFSQFEAASVQLSLELVDPRTSSIVMSFNKQTRGLGVSYSAAVNNGLEKMDEGGLGDFVKRVSEHIE